MKLVRIRKNDSARRRRGDADGNGELYDWIQDKDAEGRRKFGQIISINWTRQGVDMYLSLTAGRHDRADFEDISKAAKFLDSAASECRKKFPGVKVDW